MLLEFMLNLWVKKKNSRNNYDFIFDDYRKIDVEEKEDCVKMKQVNFLFI